MKITLENYKCPSWNILYSGKHYRKRMEMAEFAHQSVDEALNGVKMTLYATPVNITVVGHFKSRIIDSDNIVSKLLIDSLKGKLIKDDSPQYVRRVTTESVKAEKDYTEIIIEVAV